MFLFLLAVVVLVGLLYVIHPLRVRTLKPLVAVIAAWAVPKLGAGTSFNSVRAFLVGVIIKLEILVE